VAAYEPEEDETVSAAVIKKVLKELIDDLADSAGDSARKERENLRAQESAIIALEQRIKENRAELKSLTDELALKLQFKRLGDSDFKTENLELLRQVDARLSSIDSRGKDDKRKIAALQKDKAVLDARIAKTNALLAAIGGQLTEAEARELILKKLYDIAGRELDRYLNAEKQRLVQSVENLWDKYAVSCRTLESARAETLKTLDGFIRRLGYV
jgi:type I restriction enzyme M protein